MKKIMIIFSLFSIFIIGCGNNTLDNTISDKGDIPVRVISLDKQFISKEVVTSGQFTSEDETFLSFKTGGIISKINVKEGDRIRKGQVLASLELTEIKSQVLQAKSGYEKSLRDFNRVSNLYKDSVATLEQMQNVQTALDIASNQFEIANFNQNHSIIRALSDGFVLKKLANEGQVVGTGTPILQTNGAKKDNWVLKVGVNDREWSSIQINDKAEIEIDAYPNQKLSAFVYKKSESIDPQSGSFTIYLKLKSKNVSIASGMFGKARIYLKESSSAWEIPYDALLDGDNRNGFVFVTNDLHHANKIKVAIRDILKDKILIETGLENSRYLVVSGSAYLNDKSKIKIVK